jgi:ABC-type Fe3+/spermidine/putrescine transport system ATPase subunit
MTEVALSEISFRYPGAAAPAVDRLSLGLASGSLTALLGPSGCGKSTALRLIAGLLAPGSGTIRLDGVAVDGVPPERRGTVLMFQSPLLLPHLTVAGNVGFGLRMRGLPRREEAARVAGMLARVQLDGFGPRRPAALSGGQQQRVALARALVTGPRVLLLDEPLASLDAHLRDEMRALIRDLQRALGITMLVVTHDQEEAAVLGDRIALMLGGRLAQAGTAEELWRRPQSRAVAQFFGGRNFLPGRAEGDMFAAETGLLRLAAPAPAGAACVTIRPESIRVGPGPGNNLAVTLRGIADLGGRLRLHLAAGPVLLEALVAPHEARGLRTGEAAVVHLAPEDLWPLP